MKSRTETKFVNGVSSASGVSNVVENKDSPLNILSQLLMEYQKAARTLKENLELVSLRRSYGLIQGDEREAMSCIYSQVSDYNDLIKCLEKIVTLGASYQNSMSKLAVNYNLFIRDAAHIKEFISNAYNKMLIEFYQELDVYKKKSDWLTLDFKDVLEKYRLILEEVLGKTKESATESVQLQGQLAALLDKFDPAKLTWFDEIADVISERKITQHLLKDASTSVNQLRDDASTNVNQLIDEASTLIKSINTQAFHSIQKTFIDKLENLAKLKADYLQLEEGFDKGLATGLLARIKVFSGHVMDCYINDNAYYEDYKNKISEELIKYLDSNARENESLIISIKAQDERPDPVENLYSEYLKEAEAIERISIDCNQYLNNISSKLKSTRYKLDNDLIPYDEAVQREKAINSMVNKLSKRQSKIKNKISNILGYLKDQCEVLAGKPETGVNDFYKIAVDASKNIEIQILEVTDLIEQANCAVTKIIDAQQRLDLLRADIEEFIKNLPSIAKYILSLSSETTLLRVDEHFAHLAVIKNKWDMNNYVSIDEIRNKISFVPSQCVVDEAKFDQNLQALQELGSASVDAVSKMHLKDGYNFPLCQNIINAACDYEKVRLRVIAYVDVIPPISEVNNALQKSIIESCEWEKNVGINMARLVDLQRDGIGQSYWQELASYRNENVSQFKQLPVKVKDLLIKAEDIIKQFWGREQQKESFEQIIFNSRIKIDSELTVFHNYLIKIRSKKLHAEKYVSIYNNSFKKIEELEISLKSIDECQAKLDIYKNHINTINELKEAYNDTIIPLKELVKSTYSKNDKLNEDLSNQIKHYYECKDKLNSYFGGIKAKKMAFNESIINAIKNIEFIKKDAASFNQNVFVKMKNEFLLSGRSSELIASLKKHGQSIAPERPGKSREIEDFVNKFYNASQLTTIEEMTNHLTRNVEEGLLQNTGYSGWFGRPSKTKKILTELAVEWKKVEDREQKAQADSITCMLMQDYNQMRDEYREVIKNKNFTADIPILKQRNSYERYATILFTSSSGDEMVSDEQEKNKRQRCLDKMSKLPDKALNGIKNDFVYIQKWAVDKKIKFLEKYLHFKCAKLVRIMTDASYHYGGISERSKTMAKDCPFTMAYHALRCHLEKCPTRRKNAKVKLWKKLDAIAVQNIDENRKYEQMKEIVTEFYYAIRGSANGSAGCVFGKGSRLADWLEEFLTTKTDLAIYKIGLGDGSNQLPQVKSFLSANYWLNKYIFNSMLK